MARKYERINGKMVVVEEKSGNGGEGFRPRVILSDETMIRLKAALRREGLPEPENRDDLARQVRTLILSLVKDFLASSEDAAGAVKAAEVIVHDDARKQTEGGVKVKVTAGK